MAVAKNGSTQSGSDYIGTGSCNTGATVTTTVTNCLLVAMCGSGGASIFDNLTVSGGGLSWTRILRISGSFLTDVDSEIWVAWSASTITNQTITVSGSSNNCFIAVQAFSGSQDYSSLVANSDYATASSSNTAGTDSAANITTIKNGSWVVGMTCFRNGSGYSQDSNCSSLASASGVPDFFANERNDSPLAIGTYGVGITSGSSLGYSNAVLEIIPAASVPTIPATAWQLQFGR